MASEQLLPTSHFSLKKGIISGFGIFAKRLEPVTNRLIAIEIGIQNGTLAIALTAGLLNNLDMAIPALVYSLWMYLSAFTAVYYGRKLA